MSNILILGGSGYLGKAILRCYQNKLNLDYKLLFIDREQSTNNEHNYFNIKDYKSIDCLVKKYDPVKIVSFAGFASRIHAQKDPINCFLTNSLAVLNLAKLAEKYPDVEVIQVSSSHAFFDYKKANEAKEVYSMSRVLEHNITETFYSLGHSRLRILYLPNVESADRGENYLIGKLLTFFGEKFDKKLFAPLKLNNVNASLSAITLTDFINWFFEEVIEGSIFNENARIILQPAETFEIIDIVSAVLRKYGFEFDEYRSDDKIDWNCKTTSQTLVTADFLDRPDRYERKAQVVKKVTIGGKRRTADEFVRTLF